ncbi:uncharacterized protein LOC121387067 [Gigantopelta aegis]|uniref:uncharacterized protein LOC121387067 n=1 Tax=Gigantopelta aegis TaxID=1735272 RepID=UPI001B888B6F|nr:uncharacterized protein LOC121387067 [Gigantopelta aegis]
MSLSECLTHGDEAFLHKDFETALSFYNSSVDEDKDDVEAYRKRGFCHFEMQNYADALSDAAAILERKPRQTTGHILRGKCFTRLKRFEEAYFAYKEGLDIDPKDPTIANDLNQLQKEIISFSESADTQESSYDAVKLCSQEPYPGDEELERLEQEIMTMWKLDELPSVNPRVPNEKLSTLEMAKAKEAKAVGNSEEILKCLTLALEFNVANLSLWRERAEFLKGQGELREAFRTCNAIQMQHRTSNDWILGGQILSDLGIPVAAESWFRKATELSDSSDTEAAMLFQKVRVGRLYGPLTSDSPVEVTFTKYGRAVCCKSAISAGQIIFTDKPLILAQTLDSQHIPACDHCATSLLRPEDAFKASDLQKDKELSKAISQFWPKRPMIPCRKCKTQKYCSEVCAKEAWETYHRVICPATNPRMERLHQVCIEYNALKSGNKTVWNGWWNASFSPILMARIWGSIACEGKRLAVAAGRANPIAADWSMAQAPYRRFIAYGNTSIADTIPKMYSLMVDIFKNIGDGMKYTITKREFDGRYYQCACNVQAFSDFRSPLKYFTDYIKNNPKLQHLLQYVPRDPPEAEFAGLFPLHACLNHSCANSAEIMDGVNQGKPGVAVRARQAIKPGEEIFINYIDTRMARRQRRAWLYRAYNFWCHCPRCQFEGDGPEVCTQCGKKHVDNGGKMFPMCSKCKKAWYCSQNCQKIAWKKGHKKICSMSHSSTGSSSDVLISITK